MRMSIDKAISWLLSIAEHEGEEIQVYDEDVEAIKIGIDTMRKYQMFQAEYVKRLKADMVAMLTELQLEIEEFMGTISPNYDEAAQDISKVIQRKINALKGEHS